MGCDVTPESVGPFYVEHILCSSAEEELAASAWERGGWKEWMECLNSGERTRADQNLEDELFGDPDDD